MLLQPCFHDYPFPFFSVDETFSDEMCAELETLFSQDDGWQHRDGAFYQCSILDVTQNLPKNLQNDIIARMREITSLPLIDSILVTAQQMQPGQTIGVHSDRPLLGYELLRLVVQFNRNWREEHGGILELFTTRDGDAVASVEPLYNKGFIFELNDGSYHGVTEATQPRRSLVFNFWHVANTPELEEHLKALFKNIHFSELPRTLDPIASSAELELSEETTFIAETAAVALKRWGYDDATIIAGYQYSGGLTTAAKHDAEVYAAVRLAHWVATLYRQSFNLKQWHTLHSDLAGLKVAERIKSTWLLCLPELN